MQTAFRAATNEAIGRDLIARYNDIMTTQARDAFLSASRGVTDAIRAEARRLGLSHDLVRSADNVVAALYGGLLDRLETVRRARVADMQSVLAGWALGVERPATAVAELGAALDLSMAQTITLVDTTIMGVDRAVLSQQAEDAGVEWYAYDGPSDMLTRQWCRYHIDKRWTREQIDRMNNDTGPNPPMIYGGGYNCRHRWIPLVGDDAIARWPRGM